MSRDTKTEVVHVKTDTADDYAVAITVRRHPANEFYTGTPPFAADVPEDIIEAVTRWIDETN